jgi:ABC-type transporter Mla MlaB component
MMNSIIDIDCGERLSIADVTDLYGQLLVSLNEQQALNIDISQIARIDMAAIQLLYSFQREATLHGVVVIWSPASQAFSAAVAMLAIPAFYQSSQPQRGNFNKGAH